MINKKRKFSLKISFFTFLSLLLIYFYSYQINENISIFLLNFLHSNTNDLKLNVTRAKYNFDCNLLFEMNAVEINRAKTFLIENNNTFRPIRDENYIFNHSMCSIYKSSFFNQTNLMKITQAELEFPLAFAILTYQHAEQIHRLLKLIYRPHNFYCIHIDTKSTRAFRQAIESISKCFDNIMISSQSETIKWGSFSILQAELNCMKDLLKNSTRKWNYLIHMSGNEMPLRTNYELVKILNIYNGTNEVEIKNDSQERYSYLSLPPHNYSIYKGSTNGVLSRQFVEYVLTNERVKDLIEWSKKSWIPDEM